MDTQRARPRIAKRQAPEQVDPELVRARAEIEHELSELSEYLDACANERVSLGLWSETWA